MKIPGNQLVIFLSGTVKFQVGWLLLEFALLDALFCQYPNAVSVMFLGNPPSIRSVHLLTCVGLLLVFGGILTGWRQIQFLRTAKVVSGRTMSIKEDNSFEDIRYQLKFEYMDDEGQQQSVQLERDRDGIAAGQTMPMVIGENGNRALVEHDLAGGLKLANLINAEPVSPLCVLRVTVIPLLFLATLLAWQPAVAAFVKHIIDSGYSSVILLPAVFQIAWLVINKRYFGISITEICVCGGQKCDRR